MPNHVQWAVAGHFDPGIERLKSFTESLAPVVAKPTESHLQEFAAVIENVIVPRLLMSHVQNKPEAKKEAVTLRNVEVTDFVALTMKDDPDLAIDYVRHLLTSGVQFQDVLMELMAPAARILGEKWEQDSTSFVEVALGVARMHRILREFDGVPAHLWSNSGEGRHALLLPTPGEKHTFGLRLVQEFLLRESWTVTNRLVPTPEELVGLVSSNSYDIVGLSLSGETLIDQLISSIQLIKSHSVNRQIRVIVGGHLFVERPELVETCGSDGYAVDAPDTVRILNGWVKHLPASS